MVTKRKQFDFTSEAVSEGHPDKVCDRISDTVLDEIIKEDPKARVACETVATTNKIILGGETSFANKSNITDFSKLIADKVRSTVREIGYEQDGFHWENLEILNFLHEQSPDIAQGVEKDGAGDQGIMFGYAVDETPELMPAPLQYSQAILKRLSIARRDELKGILGPDSKSQLTISYIDGRPSFIKSIVVSTQHLEENLTSKEVKEIILATNSTLEGETTSHYIYDHLKDLNDLRMTKLAQGVPLGGELEYVDRGTIMHAFSGRVELK